VYFVRADWITGTHHVTKMEYRKNIGGHNVSAKSTIQDWVFYMNHFVKWESDGTDLVPRSCY